MCGNILAEKRREMQGHGEAIVPHVVEFQENHNGGLIIQFYDYDRRTCSYRMSYLYGTHQVDDSMYRIIIKDAPKKTTVWTVIGVDEDELMKRVCPGHGFA